jgi:hypothetical protein
MVGALKLLELILGQPQPSAKVRALNGQPDYAFGLAVKAVLKRMTPQDATAALALARRVTSEYHRGEALALAARLQPRAEAAALWPEALEQSDTRSFDGRAMNTVVGIAYGADPAAGDALLSQIEDRFFEPGRWQHGQRPEIPAFYYARTQPGRGRVWLEFQWASDPDSDSGYNRPYGLQAVAVAMSAIDIDRALEMAVAIPSRLAPDGAKDFSARWEAQRKIAQFAAAPEEVRRTLHFNRLLAGDTWTPGEDPGW